MRTQQKTCFRDTPDKYMHVSITCMIFEINICNYKIFADSKTLVAMVLAMNLILTISSFNVKSKHNLGMLLSREHRCGLKCVQNASMGLESAIAVLESAFTILEQYLLF